MQLNRVDMRLRLRAGMGWMLAWGLLLGTACGGGGGASTPGSAAPLAAPQAIQHVVVIFQENVSFDHYFATYPHATNPAGEPAFAAAANTPAVNGLSGTLLTANGNFTNPANGSNAANPFRLDRSQAATADQDHGYLAEQEAFDNGKMDLFPKYTGHKGSTSPVTPQIGTTGLVMGYYDGNTVTALWNYAQRFALSDAFFGATFGSSTLGALNLVSGQTDGIGTILNGPGGAMPDGDGGEVLISDSDPVGDVCSTSIGTTVQMTGKNVGDLLNAAKISWGFFEGGFDLAAVNPNGTTGCARSSSSTVSAITAADYVPHHEPFQYYASTANPTHARPAMVASIGQPNDPAAHNQYDINDFFTAVAAGNFPAVSFLKAPAYEDGHADYSNPLDEQAFLVQVINSLQQQSAWTNTAVIIAYDDSDGWYDHVAPPLVNSSTSTEDAFTSASHCGSGATLPGVAVAAAQGRCGHGPRLPLLVISPWANANYVDHNDVDQTSILRFIEDTFLNGQRLGGGSFDALAGSLDTLFNFSAGAPQNSAPLMLDPTTGLAVP